MRQNGDVTRVALVAGLAAARRVGIQSGRKDQLCAGHDPRISFERKT